MKTGKLVWCVVFVMALMTASVSGQFYYGSNGPISLEIDSLKVTLKFDTSLSPSGQQALLQSIDRIIDEIEDDHLIDGFIACSLSIGDGYGAFIDSLDTLEGIYLVEPYYLMQNDSVILVGETFCVAFDTNLSAGEIDGINAGYKVVIDRDFEGMPNVFVLRNTDSSGYRILDLANTYHNLPQTRYAHPNFGVRIKPTSYKLYDYYHQYQPHTKKVIGTFNAASVWDFAGLSRPITVAVLDDGVTTHEDLPDVRVLAGYDFADDDADPKPGGYRAHGMACSGIIGASHTTDSSQSTLTSTGIISLNPVVNILPIKIYHDNGLGVTADKITQAVTYARTHGADILSNSWGFGDPSYDYPLLNEALELATLFGRNGRGCPVIFAAGNLGSSGVDYPAALPYCFSVGATRLDDSLWYYSSYGTALDIVAPSGDANLQGDVWTLDQMGGYGQNPKFFSICPPSANDIDYHCRFGGTSAACPVVSGVASLILAKDYSLPVDTVYEILRYSAQTELLFDTITGV